MGSLARGLPEKEFYSSPVEERRKGSRTRFVFFFLFRFVVLITTYLRAGYSGVWTETGVLFVDAFIV